MLYAILCYNNEDEVFSSSKEKNDAVMAKLGAVQEKLARQGTTLRKDREPGLVLDGPPAETKEQLLGFYVVDFANLEEAIACTRELGQVNPGGVGRPAGRPRFLGVTWPAQWVTRLPATRHVPGRPWPARVIAAAGSVSI
jgi:hypothetical protein